MGWAPLLIVLMAVPFLSVWGYFLSRRHGRYKYLPWLAPAGLLASVGSSFFVFTGLAQAFDSVGNSSLDPRAKAEMLSDGIGAAMMPGGILLAFGVLLCVISLIANLVVQVKGAPPPSTHVR